MKRDLLSFYYQGLPIIAIAELFDLDYTYCKAEIMRQLTKGRD